MSEVKMEIPTENLLKLPDKAEYRAKNGQASATVKIRNDTVYIDATCDSLQIMCDYYESKYNLYKNGYDELRSMQIDTSEKRSNPIKTVFISFFVGVVIGILLTIIVKLKFRIL